MTPRDCWSHNLPGRPRSRQLQILDELPDVLRTPQAGRWSERYLPGRAIDCFLEGPALDAQGGLFLSDIHGGRVLHWAGPGRWSIAAEWEGAPNGLALGADGRLYACDMFLGLMAVDHATGAVRCVTADAGFQGLSDIASTTHGEFYVSDQGFSGLDRPDGRLLRIKPGEPAVALMTGIPSPNGVAFDEYRNEIFLAVTRANAIWRVPLRPDGAVHRAGLFIQMSGGIGPDGIALGKDGELWVAHLGTGVWRFDRHGHVLEVLSSLDDAFHCTNIILDHGQQRVIVTAASGLLLSAPIDVQVASAAK